MQTSILSALLVAACTLGLFFAILAFLKVRTFSHHHYRITGDEVRYTNNTKDNIL